MPRHQSAVELAEELIRRSDDMEDPWLISYADLVTNLLAFMVLLVSMAGISFDSIEALPNMLSSKERQRPLRDLSTEIASLAEQEGLQGEVQAAVDQEGLAIQLQDAILFPSGVAELSSEGQRLVAKVSRLLQQLPDKYKVAVEGHTDDVPISTARFQSNWALSAARALEVRRDLAGAGIEERRLSIIAFADTRPAPSPGRASLDERRRRNRRVVIRVYF